MFNGSLECEFRKYQMFQGKLKEFRSEGNILKTEEEKESMAEKHRFKKNREFKKRMDEDEANETGDIRSFTFHKHHPAFDERMFERKEERSFRRSRDREEGDRQEGRPFRGKDGFKGKRDFRDGRNGKGDFKGKGGKRFDKTEGRNFKKNNKRYDD